jgi:hypothetical protein
MSGESGVVTAPRRVASDLDLEVGMVGVLRVVKCSHPKTVRGLRLPWL